MLQERVALDQTGPGVDLDLDLGLDLELDSDSGLGLGLDLDLDLDLCKQTNAFRFDTRVLFFLLIFSVLNVVGSRID